MAWSEVTRPTRGLRLPGGTVRHRPSRSQSVPIRRAAVLPGDAVQRRAKRALTMITETVAYLVPFDRLRRTAGSHDQKLIEAIATTCADFLAEADQNRAEGHTRTCGEALADLIHGADLSKVPDSERYLYGLALEAMCAYLGEYAGAVEGHWNDVLDDYFAAQDVPLKYSDLVFGDPVVRIPAYTDYPQVGSWPPEAVAAAVAPLQVLDLPVLREEDEEMAEAVAEVVAWVTKASGHAGWGILGFSL